MRHLANLVRPNYPWKVNTAPAMAAARDFAYFLTAYVLSMYLEPFRMPHDFNSTGLRYTAIFGMAFATIAGLTGGVTTLMANNDARNQRSVKKSVIASAVIMVGTTVFIQTVIWLIADGSFTGPTTVIAALVIGTVLAPIGWRYVGLNAEPILSFTIIV